MPIFFFRKGAGDPLVTRPAGLPPIETTQASYPPGEAEVYESEAGVGIGFAFEVGARGPAEGEEPGRARRVKSDRHDHPHSLFRFGA